MLRFHVLFWIFFGFQHCKCFKERAQEQLVLVNSYSLLKRNMCDKIRLC